MCVWCRQLKWLSINCQKHVLRPSITISFSLYVFYIYYMHGFLHGYVCKTGSITNNTGSITNMKILILQILHRVWLVLKLVPWQLCKYYRRTGSFHWLLHLWWLPQTAGKHFWRVVLFVPNTIWWEPVRAAGSSVCVCACVCSFLKEKLSVKSLLNANTLMYLAWWKPHRIKNLLLCWIFHLRLLWLVCKHTFYHHWVPSVMHLCWKMNLSKSCLRWYKHYPLEWKQNSSIYIYNYLVERI